MKRETIFLFFVLLCSFVEYTKSCSCLFQHPQTHYCQSDYVILARIKRREIQKNYLTVYKVRIKKQYKVSEKALTALKSGRLLTSSMDSMCGVHLVVGKTYVISGRVLSLRAYVNQCNLVREWKSLTRRQRKGLKLMYRYGCECKIGRAHMRAYRTPDTCNWLSNCEEKEGICMRQKNNQCMWNRNKALTSCYEKHNFHLNSTLSYLSTRWRS